MSLIDDLILLNRMAGYSIENLGKNSESTSYELLLVTRLFSAAKRGEKLPTIEQLQAVHGGRLRGSACQAGDFMVDVVDGVLLYLYLLFYLNTEAIDVKYCINYQAVRYLLLHYWQVVSRESVSGRLRTPSGRAFYEWEVVEQGKVSGYKGDEKERIWLKELGFGLATFHELAGPPDKSRPKGFSNQRVINVLYDLHRVLKGKKPAYSLQTLPISSVVFLNNAYKLA